MNTLTTVTNHRILIIDDNRAIHDDFRKILCPVNNGIDNAEKAFFGDIASAPDHPVFEIESAFQGDEGVAALGSAIDEDRPYAMAFVDVRMPPGIDGIETAEQLWRLAPDLQVVICTAHSDYSWQEMIGRLEHRDRLLMLKKPFAAIEALQLACALCEKWELTQQAREHLADMERIVESRTRELRESHEHLRIEMEALLASELRYRRLFESAKDGILILDSSTGMVVDVNPFMISLLGYSHDEFLGKAVWDLGVFKDLVANKEKFAELREKGYVRYESLPLATNDGRRVEVEFVSNVYRVNGSKVIQCNVRDITERKRAEEALQVSDERYRGLFEGTRDAIMTLEPPDWHFTSGNPAALKMFGAKNVEEFVSLAPWDASPERQPDGRTSAKKAREMIDVVMRDGSHFFEWTHRRIGGVDFPADVLLTRVKHGGNAMLHATVRDTTERRQSEARFRRLVESNAQGVLFWKADGQITEANDAFLRLVDYTRDDLEAGRMNWIAMTPPEYADADRRGMEELSAKGDCTPYEKEYLRKDGSRVQLLIGAATFEDSPGEGVGFAVDLTERKKLEQQFLRAQRMESIGTLAGGIAHDLNNVLSPIMMSLEILRMKFTDPASQELFAILQTSAQRGADLVKQVLSFARGVEGRRMQVQVRHIVQEIEKIANDTFLKHIRVLTIIPHDLWTVVGDPTQLHQVLMNLCVNARDAMPNGGTLTISAENLTFDAHSAGMSIDAAARPGPYLILQVKDTGTGIPAEVVEKIFDPFFTTKELGKGTGLGLSTTLGIVKSHGGFIRVDSQIGKGTLFTIYLPAKTDGAADAAAEAAADLPRGYGELILVVDDESAVCEITRQTLEAFGYRVILAANGVEAVAVYAARRGEISAVLTDLMMPVMDGPATIRVLFKMNPAVRIIAASGLSAQDQVAQATSLGVKNFLAKPYRAETLLKTLREVLAVEPQITGAPA